MLIMTLFTNAQTINTLLSEVALRDSAAKAEQMLKSGNCEESIALYQNLMALNPENRQRYATAIAEACFAQADSLYKQLDYEKSIEFFERGIASDSLLKSRVYPQMARIYLVLGNIDLSKANYETSAANYKKALACDSTLLHDISMVFSKIHKNPLGYTLLSFIPGLGQIANGKLTRGLIQFSVFAFCVGEGVHFQQRAKDSFANSDGPFDLDAIRSAIYFGVAAMLVVYSIIDSNMDITHYNRWYSLYPPAPVEKKLGGFKSLFSFNVAL